MRGLINKDLAYQCTIRSVKDKDHRIIGYVYRFPSSDVFEGGTPGKPTWIAMHVVPIVADEYGNLMRYQVTDLGMFPSDLDAALGIHHYNEMETDEDYEFPT